MINKYSGMNNPNADIKIYSFYNKKTKESFTGTRNDFHKKYYPNRNNVINNIISGTVKKTRDGWTLSS